jgi:hypothetical protein
MATRTRNRKSDSLLGHGSDISLAIGKKLPLKRAVMKRYIAVVQPNKKTRNIFKDIFMELKCIW